MEQIVRYNNESKGERRGGPREQMNKELLLVKADGMLELITEKFPS